MCVCGREKKRMRKRWKSTFIYIHAERDLIYNFMGRDRERERGCICGGERKRMRKR